MGGGMAKILVVEDDVELSTIICDELKLRHHVSEVAHDGTEAYEKLRFYKYDLIILDWALPGMSGVEICKAFRDSGGKTPLLMLTGKNLSKEKELGLDSGADDYLTKPFDMAELAARVRALLRRPAGYTSNAMQAGNIELDAAAFRVTRDGAEVKLQPKEFALLEFLMRHRNQFFTSEQLLDRVWKSESDATAESLRTCVKRLREKIDTDGEPSIIENVRRMGYRVVG